MRKLLCILLTTILSISLVCGCSCSNKSTTGTDTNTSSSDSSNKDDTSHNTTSSTDNDSSNNSTANGSSDGTDNSSDNNDSNSSTNDSASNNSSSSSTEETPTADFSSTDDDMFTNRDTKTEYDNSGSITITLNGNSAKASSSTVKISGTTITLTAEATYIISGTLNDGMIIVDMAEDAKPQLVLNGASITSSTSAAIYVLEADKVFVTLADGTKNTLANSGSFVAIDDNNIDAALFSKQDLTLNGSGSLTVKSPAGHGIVCKDDLVVTSGTYNITSGSDGINANDSVRLADATITINAGSDGIQVSNDEDTTLGFMYISSGTYNITAVGDGIKASYYIQIENGKFTIKTTGSASSSSAKGIKATNSIQIANGTFNITSTDDCIHTNQTIAINGGTYTLSTDDDGIHADETLDVTACNMTITDCYEGLEALNITISGGDITITASDDGINAGGGTDSSGTGGMFGGDNFGSGRPGRRGNSATSGTASINITDGNITIYSGGDGLDANGTLTISGGYIYVANPKSGDTSIIDSDQNPIITGGTFISTGITTTMAQTFGTASTQGVIACTTGTQSAGSKITISDSNGKEIISYTAEYTTVLVIISSPDIVKGQTYTITVGSNSGEITAS